MDTHWRNSMKPARFFFMDARAAVPFVFALLHLRWYTVMIAAFTTMVFYFLEMRGLSFVAALRAFRVWLVTCKRPANKASDTRRWIDFAIEPLPESQAHARNEQARDGSESAAKSKTTMVNGAVKTPAKQKKIIDQKSKTVLPVKKPKPKA